MTQEPSYNSGRMAMIYVEFARSNTLAYGTATILLLEHFIVVRE